MDCYLCGKDIGDKIGLCEECRAGRDAAREDARPPEKITFPRWIHRALMGFVALLAVSWWAYGPKNYGELPEAFALEGAMGGSEVVCRRGETCVVAYLTPWCPACKKAAGQLPEVQQFIESSGAGRFVAVIGSDSPQNLRSFAGKCRVPTLIDTNSDFVRAVGSGGVPRFYKIDSEGIVRRAY